MLNFPFELVPSKIRHFLSTIPHCLKGLVLIILLLFGIQAIRQNVILLHTRAFAQILQEYPLPSYLYSSIVFFTIFSNIYHSLSPASSFAKAEILLKSKLACILHFQDHLSCSVKSLNDCWLKHSEVYQSGSCYLYKEYGFHFFG